MRKTKTIAQLIILLIFTVSTLSVAQDDTRTGDVPKYKCTPEEQAKKITDKMKKHLDLTDEQYNKVLKLQTDRITYHRELQNKDLISKSEVKQKKEEFRNGMKSILTDDQQKKMKKFMNKKHLKHKRHNGRR